MWFDEENNKLHYDLGFLEVGGTWKPKEDSRRMENYRFAREEFELTAEDMIRKIVPSGILNLRGYDDFVHSISLFGYPRLLTLKTCDMVIGEPPVIDAQADAGEDLSEKIKDIRNLSQLNYHFKQGVIDYSRFGVLLMRVFKDNEGKAKITAWDPNEWVPVFYNDGTRRIHYNVIGWYSKKGTLNVQIHDTSNGVYEERICDVDETGKILKIVHSKKYNTLSGKNLLFAVPNTPTTTNPMGTNDYEIINGLLQKAIERLKAILRVLDEHADPSMCGPSSLLTKATSGEIVFKTSKYYAVGDEEKEPKYIVWDANLDSSFKAFDKLCEQIYILSEMGSAFIGASNSTGNVVSGTAMRFKMVSPLEKARRIQNDLTQPLKEIISSLLSIEGYEIDSKNINITWKDSLPKDPRELAELAKLEAGVVAIKPLMNSLMDNYGIDKDTALSYIDKILKDQESFKVIDSKVNDDVDDIVIPGKIDARTKGSKIDPTTSQNLGKGGAENIGNK